MLVNRLEALVMVFESCEGQGGVHSRLLQLCHIDVAFFLHKHGLKLAVLVVRDVLKDELGRSVGCVND